MSSPQNASDHAYPDHSPRDTRKRKLDDITLRCMTPEHDPWLFTDEEISETPSRLDGISEHVENLVVSKCARFILDIGHEMSIPSLTVAVAITFFQRFYMLESVLVHVPSVLSVACLFLACKVQETHKRLKDIIFTAVKIRTFGSPDYPEGLELYEDSPGFYDEKMGILDKEREVLRVLNFDLTLELPYKALWTLSRNFLKDDGAKGVTQAAWNFVNDSYETYVHVRFDPKEIATAAFFLAAKLHQYELPDGTQRNSRNDRVLGWHELFNVNIDNVKKICHILMDIYEKKSEEAKANLAELSPEDQEAFGDFDESDRAPPEKRAKFSPSE